MARGIDHIVHAVRDLDGAMDLYRRLGFTVGARNKHSWGTHNAIVQFPGAFIELLTLAEPDKLGTDDISRLFGAFNGNFLKHGEGLSMLVLESRDAKADAAAFRAGHIAASEVMRFEREAKRPGGETVKVAFSLAFAADKAADAGFFVCQQHYPENFWNPAFQRHANGAEGIAGVVFAAERPAELRDFMLAFAGAGTARAVGDGFAIDTPRGEIEVATPAAFRSRFGARPPDMSRGARLAAICFSLGETTDATERAMQQAEIRAQTIGGTVVVALAQGMGATLVFESTG